MPKFNFPLLNERLPFVLLPFFKNGCLRIAESIRNQSLPWPDW
jgi:hypothetical protein